MIAFVFPGQGSQKIGMGAAALERLPACGEWFERAAAVLGYDIGQMCLRGPEELLLNTLHAQPALLTVGMMHLAAARAAGLEPRMMAGHSVGEYAALAAGGVLDFEDALCLVKRRAELMAAAAPGAMAALIGLAQDAVESTVAQAAGVGILVVANFNSPGQVVVSGVPEAVGAAMEVAKANGARMTVKLAVSGAFHSPLMAEAGALLAQEIEKAPMRDSSVPIYQNTTATPAMAARDLRRGLLGQMTQAVQWSSTIENMTRDGANDWYELGPGNVLTGLGKRIEPSASWRTT